MYQEELWFTLEKNLDVLFHSLTHQELHELVLGWWNSKSMNDANSYLKKFSNLRINLDDQQL